MKAIDVIFKQMSIHFIRLFYFERRLICDNNIYTVHNGHTHNPTCHKTLSTQIVHLYHTAMRSGSIL